VEDAIFPMSRSQHKITRDDILKDGDYDKIRDAKRRETIALKGKRRMSVGPYATFYFESYDTMWYQVHEMLRAERGGKGQIEDELSAYNPLVPNGRELVATLMFEISDPVQRQKILATLGGVEATVTLRIGTDVIDGIAEADVDRTTAAGKASSVHFLHFPLDDAQAASFKKSGVDVVLAIDRHGYRHMARMPEDVRRALAADLD